MSPPPPSSIHALLREESFVRGLARALVGDGHRADEVVQDTWVRALERAPTTVAQPRSWLARVVRSVASNQRRDERRAQGRERVVAQPEGVPSSAELLEREERRAHLVRAVDQLPADLRAVILLRFFEGLPPRAIAVQLGLPVAAVYAHQRRAVALLRAELERRSGGRASLRGWLLPLLGAPGAGRGDIGPLGAHATWGGFVAGVLAMTHVKTLGAVAVLAAILFMVWPAGDPGAAPTPFDGGGKQDVALVQGELGEAAGVARSLASEPARREDSGVTAAADAITGGLLVVARHGDGSPAPGVSFRLRGRGDLARFAPRRMTDTAGEVVFDQLSPGRVVLSDDRFSATTVEVAAGEVTRIEWELPKSIDLAGRVVDPNGQPIAGALIEVVMAGMVGVDPEVLARTDRNGRYAIRGLENGVAIGARASGFLAANMRMTGSDPVTERTLNFVLVPGGGSVAGIVVDADGKPCAGAFVCVGEQSLHPWPGMGTDAPLPALARTDASGEFLALGITAGDRRVWVEAPGHAPWQYVVAVPSLGTARVQVRLRRGAVVRGVVRNAGGIAVAAADVRLGDWMDLDFKSQRSAANGSFEFVGVGSGAARLRAEHDDHGKADTVVEVGVIGELAVELQLSRGVVLAGSVRDQDGRPVAKAAVYVEPMSDEPHFTRFGRSDDDGAFAIANCPDGLVRVKVLGKGIDDFVAEMVDPGAGPLELRVQQSAPAATVAGVIVDGEGMPVVGARISLWTEQHGRHAEGTSDQQGRFEVGSMQAGEWVLGVRAAGFPSFRLDPRPLFSGERWDVGLLTLTRGGRLVIPDLPLDGVSLTVARLGGDERWAFRSQDGVATSPQLPPGRYRLMAWGPQLHAQVQEFTIETARDSSPTLDRRDAVMQRIEFGFADGVQQPIVGGQLEIYRGDALLVDTWLSGTSLSTWATELALLPGEYRVVMRGRGAAGEGALTVGDRPSPPLRMTLR